ncbi:MAG TPA: hypothetical protein VNT55_18965 [Baekduia sp.]|nr:hypothetical protein [Baekduia sp.]
MELHIDLETVPPAVALHDAYDFKGFKVIVRAPDHAWVPVSVLEHLAGDRADEPEWRAGLAELLEYAQQHGFLDDRGIRAHIERRP